MVTVSIPLHSRKYPDLFALIDEEDYPLVSQYRWHPIHSYNNTYYAQANIPKPEGGYRGVRMHRMILSVLDGVEVDHWDGNGLNNRRKNLRECTHSQNMANRGPVLSSSASYRGVSLHKPGLWRAIATKEHLGLYDTPEDAARAYDARARELWGEFAWLNFPDDPLPAPDSRGQVRRDSKSGLRGVRFHKQAKRKQWQAMVVYEKRRISLGYYATPEEAARIYDAKARELFGDEAQLNYPRP